ncbi:hypothetical protein F5I97DRAFT_1930555 [Phlebopus sp. FC_14]|nr:hypothetical protein F5I97DRAFT_1930555 [Phlebopus sp. FC_14]
MLSTTVLDVRYFPGQPNKAQPDGQRRGTSNPSQEVISQTKRHQTLYNLANYLGALAMITVVAYHFVAVNARYLAKNGNTQ